ncbi:MAG: Fic family protein [Candidatus Anstonellales archaeon]
MKELTVDILIHFNKTLHRHGIPKPTEQRMKQHLFHILNSCKNDLCILSWLLAYILQEHPFVDGNKRTAAFLLEYYLQRKKLFLDNSTKLQLLLKYTNHAYRPSKIYRELFNLLGKYNPNFTP